MHSSDRLFRQIFHEQPGPDLGPGWDMPSERVWEAVAGRLQRDRRRRRFFWWIFGSAAGIALLVSLALWKHAHPRTPPVRLDETPVAQEILSIRSDAASVHDDLHASRDTVEIPGSRKAESTIHLPQPLSGIHSGKDGRETQTADALVDDEHEKDRSMDAFPQKQPGLQTASRESDTHVTRQESASIRQRVEVSPCRITTGPLTYVRPLPVLSAAVNPVASGEMLTDESRKWALSVYGAPSWGMRHIHVPDGQPEVRRRLLLRHEDPALRSGFGIRIHRALSPKWSVSSGVDYDSYALKGSYTHQVRFTHAGERLNGDGNLENSTSLNLNTSFGSVATQVVLERTAGTQIDEHRFINLHLETTHTMKTLQVPLLVEYHLPAGKFALTLTGGATASFILENLVNFRVVRSLDQQISDARVAQRVEPMGTRKMAFGYHFGAGISRTLNQRWSVFGGPAVSGALQSVHRNEAVEVYPAHVEVMMGVRYKL